MSINGDAWPLVSQEQDYTCDGIGGNAWYWTGWYATDGWWSSDNTSIATVIGDGGYWGYSNPEITTGPNGGTANINVEIDWDYFVPQGDGGQMYCDDNPEVNYISAPLQVPTLTCSPMSVTRGDTVTCSVTAGNTFNWTFTDSNTNTVTASTSGTNTWTGTMVTSGTIAVTVNNTNLVSPSSILITVTNRNWHTNPASPTEVANNTFFNLPVPPAPTGFDSGLGHFDWRANRNGINFATIGDGGPNQAYTYWPSNLTWATFDFRYEINPDLENTGSNFYVHQCGGTSGFISGSNLLTQTQRHEYNSTVQSHYAFYSNTMNSANNNPGDYLEQQVAVPGQNLTNWTNSVGQGLDSRNTNIGTAAAVEPFAVNESETGTFLGNINYAQPQYTNCP